MHFSQRLVDYPPIKNQMFEFLEISWLPGMDRARAFRVSPEDPKIVILSFIFFFILRALLKKFFYAPLADYLKISKTEKSEGKSTKYQKFIESAWYSTFYPISAFSLYWIVSQQIWWNNVSLVFHHRPHFDEIPALQYFYCIQFGYYLNLLINLLFIDEKLDDFMEMLLHHLVTLILIFLSYCILYHRMGSIVLLLHDFVDILLYVAKAFHDAGFQKVANVLFIGFTIALPTLRIWYFGKTLIYPIWFLEDYPVNFFWTSTGSEPIWGFVHNGLCLGGQCFSVYRTCVYLVCILWCLHVYWFYRTLCLLWKTIQNNGNVPGDPRYLTEKVDKKKK